LTIDADQIASRHLIEQIETGVPGLDRLLQGGLRRTGLHVVIGRAGAGKSILAHQAGAHHIRQGGTVLYLTALVETHQTLISQARTFPFFDASTVAHGFYYASLSPALERGGLQAMAEEIGRLVHERSPSLLVIDGLHALRLGAASRLDYQRWLHTLEAQAAVTGMTTVLLTHPRRGSSNDPTFTIADGIIEMRTVEEQLRSVRVVSVRKLRGVGHIGGWHLSQITGGGLHVYPRLESIVASEGVPAAVPPMTQHEFDAEGLTELMGGGVPSASTSFIIGTPGSGKSFLGLAFLCGVRKTKEKALFYGFHETPDRLVQKAESVGLPLGKLVDAGQVQLHWQPPSELLSDEIAERILRIVDDQGIRRLVLDAYNQFSVGAAVGGRAAEFFGAFCTLLRRRGVALVLTQDMTRIAGRTFDLPLGDTSQMIDNIIHVRSTEVHAEFKRLIAVLKMREQSFDRSIRELTIDAKGIRVGDVFREGESLLTGLPTFGESGRSGER
jgi:circadian clock protein KaiC